MRNLLFIITIILTSPVILLGFVTKVLVQAFGAGWQSGIDFIFWITD